MDKKLYLDISKSELPKFFKPGDPVLLPVVESKKKSNAYDIVNEELPVDFVNRMYCCLFDRGGVADFFDVDIAINLPICVRKSSIKKHGCKVVTI